MEKYFKALDKKLAAATNLAEVEKIAEEIHKAHRAHRLTDIEHEALDGGILYLEILYKEEPKTTEQRTREIKDRNRWLNSAIYAACTRYNWLTLATETEQTKLYEYIQSIKTPAHMQNLINKIGDYSAPEKWEKIVTVSWELFAKANEIFITEE